MAYPILYASIVPGTVPTDFGLGVLSDVISCTVEERRNDTYELEMVYPANGIHASEIATRRILKVKPNYTDDPQLFRIYKVGKTLEGQFTVSAQHVSYDLSDLTITSGSANNPTSACLLLQNAASGYSITTDKTGTATFRISEPSSVKSWFGGKEGSLLDVYGTGEWKYDNFDIKLLLHRGVTTPRATIRYGKNLMQLSQELSSENLCTSLQAYYKDSEGNITLGSEISTGLTADVPIKRLLDCSQDFSEAPTVAELDARATLYISNHTLTVPTNNITLDFVQMGQLKDRVDLCDKVNIYYEAYDITVSAKCIRTKWDCLEERYIETEFGDVKTSLADTLAGSAAATEAANSAASAAHAAGEAAASKKRVFISTPEPPYDAGDLWVNDGAIFVCNTARPAGYVHFIGTTTTEITEGGTNNTIVIDGESYTATDGDVATYDGERFMWTLGVWTAYDTHIFIDWELATNYIEQSEMENAITEATALITGNAGGYIVINKNSDGVPYELLIIDNTSLDSAVNVWRWNSGGLAHSGNGYDGPYDDFAITADGKINANAITTGSLNASLVNIQNLTAKMFQGGKIQLGGLNNPEGVLELRNASDVVIATMDKNGLEFFGETVGGIKPSVVFNKNGVVGYSNSADKDSTAIFWTRKDSFYMKNAVVENETSFGGKIRFVPFSNDINNGIAISGVV